MKIRKMLRFDLSLYLTISLPGRICHYMLVSLNLELSVASTAGSLRYQIFPTPKVSYRLRRDSSKFFSILLACLLVSCVCTSILCR